MPLLVSLEASETGQAEKAREAKQRGTVGGCWNHPSKTGYPQDGYRTVATGAGGGGQITNALQRQREQNVLLDQTVRGRKSGESRKPPRRLA